MKVGILTFPCSISFGAVLQMYALYRTVNDLGHEAKIINYHNEYMKAHKHITTSYNLKYIIKSKANRILHRRLYSAFAEFEKSNMEKYPSKAISDKRKLKEIGKSFNAVICGSDQVWNPDITDSDMSYFLDFCTDVTRRISYAPSFGIESFSEEFSSSVKSELEQFHSISVRERQGKEFLDDLIGPCACLVSDPTFLVSAKDWRSLEKEYPIPQEGYILYYIIKNSHSLMKHCLELSKKTGLKVIIAGGNPILKRRNKNKMIDYAVDISPAEWLYLLRNARYVVTNSFHGTAFSINYKKDFFVEFSSYTNSRLEHITTTLGLQDRILRENTEIFTESIDYSFAEKELEKLTQSSLNYLKEALS